MSETSNEETVEATQEESEFGAGLVVCLTKFAEHFWNEWEGQIWAVERWSQMDAQEREFKRAEMAKYPNGDAARAYHMIDKHLEIYGTPEKLISSKIEMWANGASDHFYDLDREKAPQPLIELADLALEIGHGFTGKTWTIEHMHKMRDLWKESALALDEMLGVRADWGQH